MRHCVSKKPMLVVISGIGLVVVIFLVGLFCLHPKIAELHMFGTWLHFEFPVISQASPMPTEKPIATQAIKQISGTLVISSATAETEPINFNGYNFLITLPQANQTGIIAYTISSTAPKGVTPPSGVTIVYGYATLTLQSPLALNFPQYSFVSVTLTSVADIPIPNILFYTAYSPDGVNWTVDAPPRGGPVNTTQIILGGDTPGSPTLSAGQIQFISGHTYYMAVYPI